MNANIILGGQPVNVLAALEGGTQAGMRQNAAQLQNKQQNTYAQHGANALRGDQNALAAIAGVDFSTANQVQQQGVQNARADAQLGINQQNLKMRQSEFELGLKDRAAQMSAQQRAQAAQEAEKGVAIVSSAQSPQQWDGLAQQYAPELVGKFDQKNALLQQFMTAAEIFKANEPAQPQSPAGKMAADLEAGLITPEQYNAANQKSGMRVTSDGEGGFSFEQGVGVTSAAPPKLTVDAAKNTGFWDRMRKSNEILDANEGQGTRFGQQALEGVPLGLGNFGRDPEFQKFDQARRDFVNAILRRESGAVIADSEFENANKQYFPVPGDSPEVIAQKRENRRTAIQGIKVGAGAGAAFLDQAQPSTGAQTDFSQMDAAAFGAVDLDGLTSEQLDAYIARGQELGL